MGSWIDLSGKKIGKLTVLKRGEDRIFKSGTRAVTFDCVCECGKTKNVLGEHLRRGAVKSCGCSQYMNRKSRYRHGMTKTRLHRIWSNMRQRCNDKNSSNYHLYGGKGIKICEEWNIFENFYEWAMANGYEEKLSIDRINSNGNYEPANCRWADIVTQNNNTSRVHFIEYNGQKNP